jgi:hypothetical protein
MAVKAIYTTCLSPESISVVVTGRSSGLLPVDHLPIRPVANSGMKLQQLLQFTATGIAPDLHRLPILIPQKQEPNTGQM